MLFNAGLGTFRPPKIVTSGGLPPVRKRSQEVEKIALPNRLPFGFFRL